MPVRLAKGTHHLKAVFEPGRNPAGLDLRFGNQGAPKATLERFRCLSP
jgi:hypothetical protein